MRCVAVAAMAVFLFSTTVTGQEDKEKPRTLVKTDGYATIKGTVKLVGDMPTLENFLKKMMEHRDKECCLDKKALPLDKSDPTWIVDPKSKGIKDVVIWVKPADEKTYFGIPDKYKKSTGKVVIDQPYCAFRPFISTIQPVYYDGGKHVETGVKLILKNSAVVAHNVRATGNPDYGNEGFNINIAPKSELQKKFNPQPLPITLQCDFHTWMSARLFVFEHPYYAKTFADGSFELMVPAGAEIRLMAMHAGVGYVHKGGKAGEAITLKRDEVRTINFDVSAPKAE